MEYRKYYNIFFFIGLIVLSLLLLRRFINHDSKILIIININDLFFICAALVFFNYKRYIGMLLIFVSFLIHIFIVIFFLSERIFKPTNLVYFAAVVYLIYQMFFGTHKS
jgi:hypothetical protein